MSYCFHAEQNILGATFYICLLILLLVEKYCFEFLLLDFFDEVKKKLNRDWTCVQKNLINRLIDLAPQRPSAAI